jgi:hypothetical protein
MLLMYLCHKSETSSLMVIHVYQNIACASSLNPALCTNFGIGLDWIAQAMLKSDHPYFSN